ncbi:hypothetical protein EV356DRAFT_467755 [Viridothelium virens]|uniref:Calcineurin-like phosphoesterase domain-containing protein n=1 Tax=Viridothelium virens TaxID=1048519 RepID=A0A6A6H778_VIRVR|nr:hypothetical protein EV356DRAFT_467755 [Viridothelium virens]
MVSLFGIRPPSSPYVHQPLIYTVLASPVQTILYIVHNVLQSLRAPPTPVKPPVRVVCISDTHTLTHASIPDGDLLIHAGDLTNNGTPSELHAQLTWLSSLPHPHKVVIAGNHDTQLDPRSRATLSEPDRSAPLPDWSSFGIHYLQHSPLTLDIHPSPHHSPAEETPPSRKSSTTSTDIPDSPTSPSPHRRHHHRRRRLHLHGSPQIPTCGPSSFAFQHPRALDAWTDTLPTDLDILITHTPPAQHLDNFPAALGDAWLLREVWRVRPRLHVCGHVHVGAGREVLWWDGAQGAYERGLGRRAWWWTGRGLWDVRLWREVVRVLVWGVVGVVWSRVWGGEERGTVLVNAALMDEATGRLREGGVHVVDI